LGKIKKIKAERRRAKVQSELKRKNNINKALKFSFLFLLFVAGIVSGYFGYNKLSQGDNIFNKLPFMGGKENQVDQTNNVTERKTYESAPEMQIDVNKEYIANFETNKGNFSVRLFPKEAPKTVNNFVFLSREGFYNGLTFHRIISDFMIQGGDPAGDGTGGPGYKFEDEKVQRSHVRGTLSMANSGPNTNGSQFFIVTAENTNWLDGKHTIFGEVAEGLDIVMGIEGVEVDGNDKPLSPVIIKNIEIVES